MLQLKNIRKSYDSKVILDSISLDINDGEIVSILGPSGSGKTTLLNAILGLTEIDGGQIIFDGKDLTNVPMKDRAVSESECLRKYRLRPAQQTGHFQC